MGFRLCLISDCIPPHSRAKERCAHSQDCPVACSCATPAAISECLGRLQIFRRKKQISILTLRTDTRNNCLRIHKFGVRGFLSLQYGHLRFFTMSRMFACLRFKNCRRHVVAPSTNTPSPLIKARPLQCVMHMWVSMLVSAWFGLL